MCGIGGIVRYDDGVVRPAELKSMADRMRHRGPDDHGFATYTPTTGLCAAKDANSLPPGQVGLAHLRLSIIDTSSAGWQPMRSPDGRYAIVFNGEIYNYLELRRDLAAMGHRFCSSSDTEVLLAAWAAWGAECLGKLVGMFAFALLDTHANSLTIARDPFGIKPLFYIPGANAFSFASELKALVPLVTGGRHLDAPRVFTYLRSGMTDRGGGTLLQAIRQVAPK